MLILLTGLPGTGKSYLAKALAGALQIDVLDRDAIRNAIFPTHDLDYSPEQNELASQITYRVAEYILSRDAGRILILDGRPFSRRAQVEEVEALAQRVGHVLRVILCWAPDEVVHERLQADLQEAGSLAADRTIAKYWRIKQEFEPLAVEHLSLNTAEAIDVLVKRVTEYLDRNH